MATGNPRLFGEAMASASALPPLLVAAERVAATVQQGVHGRRRVGQGDSFWQFRRYQAGDSISRIDWRQSAKSRAVFVRETEWEAAASLWLWRDASPSMRYASTDRLPSKMERAELLLLALGALLVGGGERLALLDEEARPATGRQVLRRIAQSLQTQYTLDEAAVQALPSLPPARPLPAWGHVVLFGDFLQPVDEIDALVRFYAGHGVRGHLVQVLDEAEEELPFSGHVRFAGLEGEGMHQIRRVEAVRAAYRQRLQAQQEALARLTRAVGWTWHRHRTDKPPQTALLALYLALAEPRGVAAGGGPA